MSHRSRRSAATPGIVLIVIGAVFLANSLDLFDIRDILRSLRDWWPLILIAIGVKMVSDSRRPRPRAPQPPEPPPST